GRAGAAGEVRHRHRHLGRVADHEGGGEVAAGDAVGVAVEQAAEGVAEAVGGAAQGDGVGVVGQHRAAEQRLQHVTRGHEGDAVAGAVQDQGAGDGAVGGAVQGGVGGGRTGGGGGGAV